MAKKKDKRPSESHLRKVRKKAELDKKEMGEDHILHLTLAQKRFLTAYSKLGVLTQAAVESSCRRSSHYAWIKSSADYRVAFTEADQEARDAILAACRRVALDDGNVPMLIHLSKGMFPEMFGTQRHEMSGPDGTPIEVNQKTTATIDQLFDKINNVIIQRKETLDTQPRSAGLLEGSSNGIQHSKNRSTKS